VRVCVLKKKTTAHLGLDFTGLVLGTGFLQSKEKACRDIKSVSLRENYYNCHVSDWGHLWSMSWFDIC